MNRRFTVSRVSASLCLASIFVAGTLGMTCPEGSVPLDPPIQPGNRAPRIQITNINTSNADLSIAQGGLVTIDFTATDNEDRASVRVFASTDSTPGAGEEFPILSGYPVGPGTSSGRAFWRTTNLTPGSYFVFAEVDDKTFDAEKGTGNPPVLATYAQPVLIVPEGIGEENGAPSVLVNLPAVDSGLSNGDILTVRYTISDPDSDKDDLTIRILFDRDRSPDNDVTDPPVEVGTVLSIPAGTIPAGGVGPQQQDITIDLNALPIRTETDEGRRPLPYFVRIQADDGNGNVVNVYANGGVRLLRAAAGRVVDLINVGGLTSGAAFHGFDGNPVNPAGGSRAGSSLAPAGDFDNDGLADFIIGAENASPYNAAGVGEIYVIYGRPRRLPSDFAAALGISSAGRLAGLNSLNTVGTFIDFPANDPRHRQYFNLRGSTVPQITSLGQTLGVKSVASLPDVTNDGLPEILVGVPFGDTFEDKEDLDPCDKCALEETSGVTFTCLGNEMLDNNLEAEADLIDGVAAGTWAPTDPATLDPLFPANVDFEFDDRRLNRLDTFRVELSGKRQDEANTPFTVTVLLENVAGPSMTRVITPTGADGTGGTFENVFIDFPVGTPNFPVGPTEKIPPSAYDGQFLLFVQPSTGVDFDMVKVRMGGTLVTPDIEYPIKLNFADGFPPRYSDNETCGTLNPPPIDDELIADFTPVCPPINRSVAPFNELGVGNRDGFLCTNAQVRSAIIAQGGLTNDDLDDTAYQSGFVFINASDDLSMSLRTGIVNPDGTVDGNYGTWSGDGDPFIQERSFGQPPYLSQGGFGRRGGRFRGAWWQPQFQYDPFSLFGYTVDTVPDFNDFAFSGTEELIVSAPNGSSGGFFGSAILTVDLSADLAKTYSNTSVVPGAVQAASASFNFDTQFSFVSRAYVTLIGTATNIPRLRVGLDDGTGHPLANGGSALTNFSRELLLWSGAGFPPAEDKPATIEWDEVFETDVPFTVTAEIPKSVLSQFVSGQGKIAMQILGDCAVRNSSVTITSATLNVVALRNSGYVTIFESDDYTCSECTARENGFCVDSQTNGDPEGGDLRPMSWPSSGCFNENARRYCRHRVDAWVVGEGQEDSLGFAHPAGNFNADGVGDIAMGAPGNNNDPFNPNLFCGIEPNPLNNNGKSYLLFGTPTFGTGRPCDFPERIEIRGTHSGDQFGRVQGNARDLDGDGIEDFYTAAEGYDALGEDFDNDGKPDVGTFGIDAGFVGVLFGQTSGNGTRSIRCEQIGTSGFPGVKFVGGIPGAHLGGGTVGTGGDSNVFSAAQRGQYGVSSAGDFNLDGLNDLLITAPGQTWPAGKIEFFGAVVDGEAVAVNGIQFEFDTNGAVTAGRIAVPLTATDALTAQRALVNAMSVVDSETLNVTSMTSQNQFPALIPDTPTINFLRGSYTPTAGWLSVNSSLGASSKIKTSEMTRQGVSYLVFGDTKLLKNKTFVLPQDINRRNADGKRVLKGLVFVSGYEKDSGPTDATPDQAPITTVAGIGDTDGDGFADILLGAPDADFINIISPQERRQAAGEVYLIYGNSFGLNASTQP